MRVSALSDQELIRLYVQGEEICFEELVNRHKDRLFTYLVLLLKDRNLAHDFFQDTLVKVIQTLKSGKYLEEGRFRPWMMKIAHNLVIDHFRRQKKMRMQYATEEFDVFDILGSEDLNREEEFVKERIHQELRILITMLPEDQKELVTEKSKLDLIIAEMQYALANQNIAIVDDQIKLA